MHADLSNLSPRYRKLDHGCDPGVGVATVLMKLVPRIWAAIEEGDLHELHLAVLRRGRVGPLRRRRLHDLGRHENFTDEPVLSAMFTFGIHGVMLIAAWLIGESFATGMNQVRARTGRTLSPPAVALSILGGGLLVIAAVVGAVRIGVSENQLLVALSRRVLPSCSSR